MKKLLALVTAAAFSLSFTAVAGQPEKTDADKRAPQKPEEKEKDGAKPAKDGASEKTATGSEKK